MSTYLILGNNNHPSHGRLKSIHPSAPPSGRNMLQLQVPSGCWWRSLYQKYHNSFLKGNLTRARTGSAFDGSDQVEERAPSWSSRSGIFEPRSIRVLSFLSSVSSVSAGSDAKTCQLGPSCHPAPRLNEQPELSARCSCPSVLSTLFIYSLSLMFL